MDTALISVLSLLAIAGVAHSATGGEQAGVVLSAIILSMLVITVSGLLIGYRRYTQRTVWPALVAAATCLCIIISVAATHWPLRVTYAMSRSAFNDIAKRILAGEQIATPLRAGLFTIRRAELSDHDIVCLWTFPQPGGNTGFVQCRRDHVPFNLWSSIPLDDRWQFISED